MTVTFYVSRCACDTTAQDIVQGGPSCVKMVRFTLSRVYTGGGLDWGEFYA
jgi:hypothetical protein